VDAYVSWVHHEPAPGAWDWRTYDLAAFLRLCAELRLYVYLRPGPYITNEQDGGGLPAWLFARTTKRTLNATHDTGHPNARTCDAAWMREVERWYGEVARVARPFLRTRGGPIVLVGVENEFDWFAGGPPLSLLARSACAH
jgi:beta-galactosidase